MFPSPTTAPAWALDASRTMTTIALSLSLGSYCCLLLSDTHN